MTHALHGPVVVVCLSALLSSAGCGARSPLEEPAPDASVSPPTGLQVAVGSRHLCVLRPNGRVF